MKVLSTVRNNIINIWKYFNNPHREAIIVPLWNGDTTSFLVTVTSNCKGSAFGGQAWHEPETIKLSVLQIWSPGLQMVAAWQARSCISEGRLSPATVVIGTSLANIWQSFWHVRNSSFPVSALQWYLNKPLEERKCQKWEYSYRRQMHLPFLN